MADTTSAELSVETAAPLLTSLLSGTPEKVSEDKPTREAQPEQAQTDEPEQAPAASDEETPASEQADESSDPAEDAPPPPTTYKTKVDGQDVEVTLDEALKGYSRTQDYTRKTQELAAQRREFEEKELAAVRAERQQYLDTLPQIAAALQAIAPKEPDPTTMAPEAFAVEWVNWKRTQDQIAQVRAEEAAVKARADADAEEGFKSYRRAEYAKVVDAIPDLKDPEKAKEIGRGMEEYAVSRGFTGEELKVVDSRLLILLHDAWQGAKDRQAAKAKAPEIKNKLEAALASSQPGARTAPTPKSKLADAKAQLRRSGKTEDAGVAINALLGIQ